MKIAFLLALATAKCVDELQALSAYVLFLGQDLSVSYLPEFVAKMELGRNPLPRSFLVRSLLDFVGDLPEECVLCPVRAVLVYLGLTKDLSHHPSALFVSPRLLRFISKNTLSFFIICVIVDAGASLEGSLPPRSHSVRGVATSAAFLRNWSVSELLEAATWRSNPVFAAFYFRDLTYSLDGCHSLGPFVVASSVLAPLFRVLSLLSLPVFGWLVLHSAVLCLLPWVTLLGTDIRLTMDLDLPSTTMHCHDRTLRDQTGWLWTSLTRPGCSLVTEWMYETPGRVIFCSTIHTIRVMTLTADFLGIKKKKNPPSPPKKSIFLQL